MFERLVDILARWTNLPDAILRRGGPGAHSSLVTACADAIKDGSLDRAAALARRCARPDETLFAGTLLALLHPPLSHAGRGAVRDAVGLLVAAGMMRPDNFYHFRYSDTCGPLLHAMAEQGRVTTKTELTLSRDGRSLSVRDYLLRCAQDETSWEQCAFFQLIGEISAADLVDHYLLPFARCCYHTPCLGTELSAGINESVSRTVRLDGTAHLEALAALVAAGPLLTIRLSNPLDALEICIRTPSNPLGLARLLEASEPFAASAAQCLPLLTFARSSDWRPASLRLAQLALRLAPDIDRGALHVAERPVSPVSA